MNGDDPNDVLLDVLYCLDAIGTAIDKRIASDDPETSYAATTAALHLHAAQAELPAPGGAEGRPEDMGGCPPDRAVEALADVVTTINVRTDSLPAEHQPAVARVAIHLAEAREALNGTST